MKMGDPVPPVDLDALFRSQARDGANEIIMTLRTELNQLHQAMLSAADVPNPTNQKKAWEAATMLAGTSIATAQAMKATYEAMIKGRPE